MVVRLSMAQDWLATGSECTPLLAQRWDRLNDIDFFSYLLAIIDSHSFLILLSNIDSVFCPPVISPTSLSYNILIINVYLMCYCVYVYMFENHDQSVPLLLPCLQFTSHTNGSCVQPELSGVLSCGILL